MSTGRRKLHIGTAAVLLGVFMSVPVITAAKDITNEQVGTRDAEETANETILPIAAAAAQLQVYFSEEVLDKISSELERTADELYYPCVTDAFTMTETLKGIQGRPEYDHYFMNCYMETGFSAEGEKEGTPYIYQGKTYYFQVPEGINELLVRSCNKIGRTVNIKFLLRYAEGKERMLDPAARSRGYLYYAPNFAEAETAVEYEAFFHFLAEKFSRADCHIDNWILANEENMPAFGKYHPYSTYYGTKDKHTVVSKYADYFICVYNAVRSYTTATRVSISVDHSWQNSDDGRGISTKDFLDEFHRIIGSEPLWYIDYHAYPAVIYDTRIWARYSPLTGTKLNPKDESARFVDGANLYLVADYVREHYGSEHRLMLTEVGFSQYEGAAEQAASFAYTYYAAKSCGMVDCLILHTYNQGGRMDFSFNLPINRVFNRIDKDNPIDKKFIEETCLPVIGAKSWEEIIPGYN